MLKLFRLHKRNNNTNNGCAIFNLNVHRKHILSFDMKDVAKHESETKYIQVWSRQMSKEEPGRRGYIIKDKVCLCDLDKEEDGMDCTSFDVSNERILTKSSARGEVAISSDTW